MNKIGDKGIKANILIAFLFALCYYITFPKTFLISDEWGYVGRAVAILNGHKSIIYTNLATDYQQDTLKNLSYPLGTTYLAALAIFLGGKKMCFLVGFLSLLISQLLMGKMLLKLMGSSTVALITWCCLPCLVISRTVMSDTPALLVSASFFYLYFTDLRQNKHHLLLGLIGGLSVLFRENLIVLFAFFLLKLFYEGGFSNRILLAAGFLIGISCRLASANYFYGAPFFYRLTTPFTTSSFIYNALFYSFSLTLFFPLASLAVIFFKNNKEASALKLASLAYLLFFCFYAYTGSISGLLRSFILGNRFFMPLLPLFMVAYAQYWQSIPIFKQKKARYGLVTLAAFMIVSTQITANYFEKQNLGVVHCTENSPTLIVSPKVTCAKYINSITSNSHLIPTEACENDPTIIRDVIKKEGYCDLFELTRSASSDSVLSFKKLFTHQEICAFTTPEGFKARVIRLK
jgi:hypothetical protein